VSRDIPYIKKVAMEVLRNKFSTKDSALMAIKDSITNFYKRNYGAFYSTSQELINRSIESISKGYSENTFPRMKVTYDEYPEHIGHLETDGCFRCHNDAFRSESGRVISKDCNLCHTIVGQGKPASMQLTGVRDALEFNHPVDIGTAWKEMNCAECHKYLY
jgi:hypothetical protein